MLIKRDGKVVEIIAIIIIWIEDASAFIIVIVVIVIIIAPLDIILSINKTKPTHITTTIITIKHTTLYTKKTLSQSNQIIYLTLL